MTDPSLQTQSSGDAYRTGSDAKKKGEQDALLLLLPTGKPGSKDYQGKLSETFSLLHYRLRAKGLSTHHNALRNRDTNQNVFDGDLSEANHEDAVAPYGLAGVQVVHDYSFFHPNYSRYEGVIRGVGLKFSVVVRGPEWEDMRQTRVAAAGAEATLRQVASAVGQQTGEDVSEALTDPATYVPQTDEEWEEPVPLQRRLQAEVAERLDEAITRNDVEEVLLETIKDGFIFEEDMVEVVIRNDHPAILRLRRSQVSLIAPDDARTDEDIDAIGIRRILSPTACMAKYGPMMRSQQEMADLREFCLNRNSAARPQLYLDSTLTTPAAMMVSSDGGYIPPARQGNGGIEEQKVYARMLDMIHVVVMTDIDVKGKDIPPRPMKDTEYKQYVDGYWPHDERVIYARLADEAQVAKAEGKGYPVRRIPIQYSYESVMLDGWYLVYHRPVAWQERQPGRRATPSLPVVLNWWDEASPVTRGLPYHELFTNMNLIQRKTIAMMGVQAIGYDTAQLPEGYTMEMVAYEMGETNFLTFNGGKISGQPTRESYKHLQAINLDVSGKITSLINAKMMLRQEYNEVLSMTSGLQGTMQARETNTQTNLSYQQGMTGISGFIARRTKFRQRVLDRMVSVGKYTWASQLLPRAKGSTLATVREMPLSYFGIYVQNSQESAENKAWIMQFVQSAIASGRISVPEGVKMRYAESDAEMLTIFEKGMTAYDELQKQIAQQQQQISAQNAEIAAQKVSMPLEVEKMRGLWHQAVEQMKQQGASGRTSDSLDMQKTQTDMNAELADKQRAGQVAMQMQQGQGEGAAQPTGQQPPLRRV